jgi:hypothetical protein
VLFDDVHFDPAAATMTTYVTNATTYGGGRVSSRRPGTGTSACVFLGETFAVYYRPDASRTGSVASSHPVLYS